MLGITLLKFFPWFVVLCLLVFLGTTTIFRPFEISGCPKTENSKKVKFLWEEPKVLPTSRPKPKATPETEIEEWMNEEQPLVEQKRWEPTGDVQLARVEDHVINLPSWVGEKSWGLRPDPGNPWNGIPDRKNLKESSFDQEVEMAWTNFFNGTTNGLVLELGALDGNVLSVSKFFERRAGWKAILIEASPQALDLPKNRPNALSLQLAVCQWRSTIHFVNAEDAGGVLELMSPDFLMGFHGYLLKDEVVNRGEVTSLEEMVDWGKVATARAVAKLPCFPLQAVFDAFAVFGLNHVNLGILDLGGGELAALKSLDFEQISFDVLCVETNRLQDEADPYIDQVVAFMTGKGYKVFQRISGRNSWFVSPDWKNPIQG